jgi:hypothetical protein
MRALRRLFSRPFLDLFRGQARCLRRPPDLVVLLLGLAVGWWVYVPIHELLHAAGCALAGGRVETLQISPLYGGALLARVFPWVEAGGEYAGRLSGFDTGGSTWVYLAADLAPFVLTLFPGVWAMRLAARGGRAVPFGVSLPFAFAPLLSSTGDAYEIGSLAITSTPAWSAPAQRALLRGDDLFRLSAELVRAEASGEVWLGFALATVCGVLWVFLTYALASAIASGLGQRPLRAPDLRRGADDTWVGR